MPRKAPFTGGSSSQYVRLEYLSTSRDEYNTYLIGQGKLLKETPQQVAPAFTAVSQISEPTAFYLPSLATVPSTTSSRRAAALSSLLSLF